MRQIIYKEKFPKDEQVDFESICRRRGFNPEQFDCQAHTEINAADGIGVIVGNVLVSHRKAIRSYPYGHAQEPWLVLFDRDLAAGVFN